jgi:hypothetical protein
LSILAGDEALVQPGRRRGRHNPGDHWMPGERRSAMAVTTQSRAATEELERNN